MPPGPPPIGRSLQPPPKVLQRQNTTHFFFGASLREMEAATKIQALHRGSSARKRDQSCVCRLLSGEGLSDVVLCVHSWDCRAIVRLRHVVLSS